ncbi:type II secretion system protein [bacterium]|nr:type II secretion system protein [bacterium]
MSSMIEVMVALGLFVLTLAFVFSPLQSNQRSALECSQRLQALALASDLMEQERSLPFDKILPRQGKQDDYTYTLTVGSQPHLKQLRLTITWGHDKQLEFGTLIQGEAP